MEEERRKAREEKEVALEAARRVSLVGGEGEGGEQAEEKNQKNQKDQNQNAAAGAAAAVDTMALLEAMPKKQRLGGSRGKALREELRQFGKSERSKNEGVDERARRDQAARLDTSRRAVTAALERKAKLYEKLSRGDFGGDDVDVARFDVDFEMKAREERRLREESANDNRNGDASTVTGAAEGPRRTTSKPWKPVVAPNGKTYYWNVIDGATTWCVLSSHWSPYDRVGVVNANP